MNTINNLHLNIDAYSVKHAILSNLTTYTLKCPEMRALKDRHIIINSSGGIYIYI